MKAVFVLLSVVLAISFTTSHAASLRVRRQLIPREFQNINIENYLKNERAVAFQLKCIIYDGPCDRIGKYLKLTIPELLQNQCRNCDPQQRMRAGRLVSHIQQNFPKQWEDAVKKFQGGLVKAEDAERLQSILGVKLDDKLVSSTTAAPTTTTTTTTTTAAPTTAAASTTAKAVAEKMEAEKEAEDMEAETMAPMDDEPEMTTETPVADQE